MAASVAVKLLQLPELYKTWSVKKDHDTHPSFAEVALLIFRWSGSESPQNGLEELKHPQSESLFQRLKHPNS